MSSDYIWSLPCWRGQLFLLTKNSYMWKCREVSILGMTIYQWEKEAEEIHQINFYPWTKVSYMTNNRLHAFIEQWRAYFIEQWRVVPMLSCFSLVWPFGPSLPGPSIHGISSKNTERVACPPSGDVPNPGLKPIFSLRSACLGSGFFTSSTSWEAPRRFIDVVCSFCFPPSLCFSPTSLLWIVPSNKALACEICHRLCFLENLD